jgi:hypothetical protein
VWYKARVAAEEKLVEVYPAYALKNFKKLLAEVKYWEERIENEDGERSYNLEQLKHGREMAHKDLLREIDYLINIQEETTSFENFFEDENSGDKKNVYRLTLKELESGRFYHLVRAEDK